MFFQLVEALASKGMIDFDNRSLVSHNLIESSDPFQFTSYHNSSEVKREIKDYWYNHMLYNLLDELHYFSSSIEFQLSFEMIIPKEREIIKMVVKIYNSNVNFFFPLNEVENKNLTTLKDSSMINEKIASGISQELDLNFIDDNTQIKNLKLSLGEEPLSKNELLILKNTIYGMRYHRNL